VYQYLVKGKQVAVEGELRQDRWEQDGQNRSKVEILANNVQLLGGGQGSGASSQGEGGFATSRRPAEVQQGRGPSASDGPADDGFADDIPF